MGWASKRNGELLRLAEQDFDVLTGEAFMGRLTWPDSSERDIARNRAGEQHNSNRIIRNARA